MYERHFGLTGPPFKLSPDPDFYFGSDQHRAALTALKRTFSREAPFVVLSGEIGAGKTTILRAWIEDVEREGVLVAQLSNTQLDADELMWAVATAFGFRASNGASGEQHEKFRGFLRGLDGCAALLVVDEAQNLGRDALRSLVALADMAIEEGARFRICLAGQPELRERVADPTLPELQSRVRGSIHLGPLDPEQTRKYIEHRLLKVGWSGTPSFDALAGDEIHRFTGGIPRRINVLSNRLLLAQFLGGTERIDASTVLAAAHALDSEIGDGAIVAESPRPVRESPQSALIDQGAILVVVGGRSDQIKAVPLLHAIKARGDLPSTVVVRLSNDDTWRLNDDLRGFVALTQHPVSLTDITSPPPDEIGRRFEQLIQRCRPVAVIVFDGDASAQRCAIVARAREVPLIQVGAEPQSTDESTDPGTPRIAIARLADLRFDCQSAVFPEGFAPAPRSLAVGNLLIDAVHFAMRIVLRGPLRAPPAIPPINGLDDRRGFGVVVLKESPVGSHSPCGAEIEAVLHDVSRDMPLVWPVRKDSRLAMLASGFARSLEGGSVACIDELGYVDFVCLLQSATCVLTNCPDVLEEAAILGVPSVSIGARHAGRIGAGGWLSGIEAGLRGTGVTRAVWEILFNGDDRRAPPDLWDGHAAPRIAAQLARWLTERHERASNVVPEGVQPPG